MVASLPAARYFLSKPGTGRASIESILQRLLVPKLSSDCPTTPVRRSSTLSVFPIPYDFPALLPLWAKFGAPLVKLYPIRCYPLPLRIPPILPSYRWKWSGGSSSCILQSFSFRYFPLLKCPIAPPNRSPLLSPDSEMHQLPLFLIQGRRKSKIKTKANANIYESPVQLSTAATTVTRSTTKRHFVFFSTFPLSTRSPLLFPCSSLPILAVVCQLPIVIAVCLEVLAPGGKGRHEEGSVGTCLVKVQVALGQNVLLYHCTDE